MGKDMIAPTPPMGWNSWNTFYNQINDELIYSIADVLVEEGYREAGYKYLIIDDCWSMKERDTNGKLVADPEKFPKGMKDVADYVHSKGLKFGMYGDCGVRTCANYPGSFEHEFEDAKQFALWEIDYLKYDNGYRPSTLTTPLLYRRMSMALKNSGRDILLAACQWGTDDVHRWIRSSGANTFRSTIDITDSWDSIKSIALSQVENQCFTGANCFNDMDMLVVGMYGKGMNPETSLEGVQAGCTDIEYETHFALWAMMGSPLIIGCDIRNLPKKAKDILLNQDIIAINQDLGSHSCYSIPVYANSEAFILVKPLADGSLALGFFNVGEKEGNLSLPFWDIGLSCANGRGLLFYDCFEHEEMGVFKEIYTTKIESHGCRVYRVKPEDICK
jgi:alpha-galactosidase